MRAPPPNAQRPLHERASRERVPGRLGVLAVWLALVAAPLCWHALGRGTSSSRPAVPLQRGETPGSTRAIPAAPVAWKARATPAQTRDPAGAGAFDGLRLRSTRFAPGKNPAPAPANDAALAGTTIETSGARSSRLRAPACEEQREICDGRDNDCDGEVDEPGAVGCIDHFFDDDEDRFGASFAGCFCSALERTATNALDCDDSRSDVNPRGVERCDGLVDNDCDGLADLCGAVPHRVLLPGELIVRRVQEHTEGLPDALGEWFELENRAPYRLELMGLEIRDDGVDRFEVRRSLVLEPGGRAVLARNGDRASNGDLHVDYVYSDFILSDLGDAIELRSEGIVIDRVRYDPSGALVADLPHSPPADRLPQVR